MRTREEMMMLDRLREIEKDKLTGKIKPPPPANGWVVMTEQQEIAIRNHCRLAAETIHPRFGMLRVDGISVVVTVNSGYEAVRQWLPVNWQVE
jgi:hypothetical protein